MRGEFATLTPGVGLLGFDDEGATLVEIGEVTALVAIHVEFEFVIATHRFLETESLAEMDEEFLRLRAFAAAGVAPLGDETEDGVARYTPMICCIEFNSKCENQLRVG